MTAYYAHDEARKCHVVVMEDDLLYRSLLQNILVRNGYTVTLAEDGIEGMKAVRRFGADIVITDLFMPEQDGLQTIMQLKREFPGVPVVAITAGTNSLSLENARETATLIGADVFVEKPLDHGKFLALMGSLCPSGGLA